MRTRSLALAALVAIALPVAAAAQAPALNWGPAPPVFPAGARMAVVQGDPGQTGMFTVRLEMPNGYRLAPHFHPTEEVVTVISGTFSVGMGDTLEPARATALPAGGIVHLDANMHHWAITRGRTVVQVNSMGPFALIYVNPADNPQGRTSTR
ncbi:MAG: cupin domain-containing protein [Gemmatimonadales bacterium]